MCQLTNRAVIEPNVIRKSSNNIPPNYLRQVYMGSNSSSNGSLTESFIRSRASFSPNYMHNEITTRYDMISAIPMNILQIKKSVVGNGHADKLQVQFWHNYCRHFPLKYLEINMPTVNTNSASTFALNKMNATERDMLTSMERLSSGKRINHAGDDAAGAAIADRMTAQIRGLEQSVRNAGDVISMAQVAEGALDESSDILQRIRELALQSASDIMNAEERSYLNAEVIQMLAELDRVTRDTTFNEIAVLDGSFADRRFQIGTHEREFAQLSISSMRLDALGAFKAVSDGTDSTGINSNLALNAYAVADTTETNLIQAETFTVHGILGSSTVTAAAGSTIRDVATSVNAIFNATGVSAVASSQLKIEAKSLDSTYDGQNSVSFTIQGKNGTSTSISANITLNSSKGSSDLSGLRDSINNYTTTTGITGTLSSDKSSIIMVQNEGYDIKLGTVNFASDTVSTGAQRVLLVTSLDNDEAAAGATVSLGDTSVTVTDPDGLVASASGTASTAMTLNTVLASTADPDGLRTTFDASSNTTTAIPKVGALSTSTTHNSL